MFEGRNTLILNQEALMKVIEDYINNRVWGEESSVRVIDVDFNRDNWTCKVTIEKKPNGDEND